MGGHGGVVEGVACCVDSWAELGWTVEGEIRHGHSSEVNQIIERI